MDRETVCIEIPQGDGSYAMFVGAVVSRDDTWIRLTDAAWVASTGRRHQFFAGRPDSGLEAEPYPDGMTVDLPLAGARIMSWPHPLLRVAT